MEAHWADLHLPPRDLADHPSTTEHTLFSIVSGLRMGGSPGLTVQGLKRTISVLQICLGIFRWVIQTAGRFCKVYLVLPVLISLLLPAWIRFYQY
eukprot:3778631-Amphidinium_carterae.1